MRRNAFMFLLTVMCCMSASCAGPNDVGPGIQPKKPHLGVSVSTTVSNKQPSYPTQNINTKPFLYLPFSKADCKRKCIMSKPDMEGNSDNTYHGHEGYDYDLDVGKSIFAPASGVAYCRKQAHPDGSLVKAGYGHYIDIDHGNGLWTKLAHLNKCLIGGGPVRVGVGQLIATSGKSGSPWFNSSPPHLHFEVLLGGPEGKKVDPYFKSTYLWISENDHYKQGKIDQRIKDLINRRRHILGATPKNDIHWYHAEDRKLVIQDVKLRGGCDAGIVFDVEGNARQERLVKCGMWKKWSAMGGPRSLLGAPITDEGKPQRICVRGKPCFTAVYQSFKHAFLVFESNDPHNIKYKTYRFASPAKFVGARWDRYYSPILADAYARLGGMAMLGHAGHPGGDTAEAHNWTANNYPNKVQDFIDGKYGWTILFVNDKKQQAYMIRSGFWEQYRKKGLLGPLGAPQGEEYLKGPNNPYQKFEGGYMEYVGATFRACLHDGRSACRSCGTCPKSGHQRNGSGSSPSGCTTGQMRCAGSVQETCKSNGLDWERKTCPHGCSNNHCNICKPGSNWCDSIKEMQVCNSDGKSFSHQRCSHVCQDGRCIVPPAGGNAHPAPCPRGQTLCKNAHTQKTCIDGKMWNEQKCKHGCSNTRCMRCKPNTSWCHSISELETCSADGFSTTKKQCSHRCDKDMCISAPRICVKGVKRCNGSNVEVCKTDESGWVQQEVCRHGCKNSMCVSRPKVCTPGSKKCSGATTLNTCAQDGLIWNLKPCPYGCSNGACDTQKQICSPGAYRCNGNVREKCSSTGLAWSASETCQHGCSNALCAQAPAGKLCIPHARRCVFGKEIQQCRADGMAWIRQFVCASSCTTGTAKCANPPTCTISYNASTRRFGVSGTSHGTTHFSTEGSDLSNSAHYMQTHTSKGLSLVLPAGHVKVFARNTDSSKDWPSTLRKCAFPKYARWHEGLKGGFVEILK